MSEWKTVPLASLVENLDSQRVPIKQSERQAGSYPYYGASGIVDWVDAYLFEGEHLLVAEDGENLNSRSVPIAFRANGRFWVNNHAHILKGSTHLLRFLEHYLNNLDIAGWVTGSAQPKLTQGNLNTIPVTLPADEKELKAIARVLGALDDKIELNRRMNQTLEELAKALFRSWFVDFDPVVAKAAGRKPVHLRPEVAALFPAHFQDSALGPIPQGWEVQPIGDVVKVVGGSTPSTNESKFWNGNIAWATPRDLAALSEPVLTSTERQITPEGLDQISSGLLPKGTVLLSSRAPIGYTAIADLPVAINQGFIALRCEGALPNIYVIEWVRENMDTIEGRANGTTFMEISKKNFRPIPTVMPPPPVLEKFSEIVSPWWQQIIHNVRESQTLAALRDTLLPKLLSGQLRVKQAEKLVAVAS